MRIDELAGGFIDERLGAEELGELAGLLDRDAGARRAFVRAVDQHRALHDLLVRSRARSGALAWMAAAAAVFVAAVLAALLWPHKEDSAVVPRVARDVRPSPPPVLPIPSIPPVPPLPREPEAPRAVAPPEAPKPPPPPARVPERPLEPPAAPHLAPPPSVPEPALPPPPPAKTLAVLATIQEGHPFRGRVVLKPGDPLFEGDPLQGSAGVAFPDGSRIDLTGEMTLGPGRRIALGRGALTADLAKEPFWITTSQAEATAGSARFRVSAGAETLIEVKEGRARFMRLEDRRAIEVGAGFHALAASGVELAPKRTTRGPMMAGAALWGEDFGDARALEKDWRIAKNGLGVTFHGTLEIDLKTADAGDASLTTAAAFALPVRVTAEVELTSRLHGALAALRLQSWTEAKELVHVDLDEDRYYLTIGEKVWTADATRKNPRRERWSVELHGDGSVAFLVEGRELLRGKRDPGLHEYHVTLLGKARRETPAGAKLRFDSLVIERIR
jgi:hypothetical protein